MDYVIRVYPRSITSPVNANLAESGEMHDLNHECLRLEQKLM